MRRERVGQRRVGKDGDRIDDHAALEPLDLAHFLGLIGGLEIAVDDPDAAGFRHRDREPRLGDGVHRRGDDRQVEADRAGELRRRYRLRSASPRYGPGAAARRRRRVLRE